MDFRNMSVTGMLPSISLFFDIEKFKDTSGSINPDADRYVWIAQDKPSHIVSLDKFLRAKFTIPEKSKMVFTLYTPPSTKDKHVYIKKSPHKLVSRVLISTIGESPEMEFMGRKTETLRMKANEAYNIPFPINGMTNITFDNSRSQIIPPRKGFRQQKLTKRVEKRYIMMFDYIFTDDITEAINELTGKENEPIRGYDRTSSECEEPREEETLQKSSI